MVGDGLVPHPILSPLVGISLRAPVAAIPNINSHGRFRA